MIELIVFDLDGTIVDSRTDLAAAANAMVGELGAAPLPEEAIVRMVGEGAAVLVRRALTASGLPPDTPRALERFLAFYDGCLLDHTLPYPGTVEMLIALRDGYRLAILTNKPAHATARVLDGLDLGVFFDPIVGGDGPFGRKPDPAALLDIIRQQGTTAASTMLVGDSPVDRETARRAGTAFCLARFGFGYAVAPSDLTDRERCIDAPQELIGVVGGRRSAGL